MTSKQCNSCKFKCYSRSRGTEMCFYLHGYFMDNKHVCDCYMNGSFDDFKKENPPIGKNLIA